jgi:hypothetical protein
LCWQIILQRLKTFSYQEFALSAKQRYLKDIFAQDALARLIFFILRYALFVQAI